MQKQPDKDQLEVFRLDPIKLDKRIVDSYPGFYLMLVGLVQGIATVYLVIGTINTEVFARLSAGDGVGIPTLEVVNLICRILIAGMAIVVVTHEYSVIVLMFIRYPGYLDIASLFLLGMCQTISNYLISINHLWWSFFGIFLVLSACSYFLTLRVLSWNLEPQTPAWRRSYRYIKWSQIWLFVAAIVCFAAVLLAKTSTLIPERDLLLYVACLLIGFVLIFRGRKFVSALRKDLVAIPE